MSIHRFAGRGWAERQIARLERSGRLWEAANRKSLAKPAVVAVLLERAVERRRTDKAGCLAYAEVAEAAAAELPPGHEALHARALAELGNALRIHFRHREAKKMFRRAGKALPETAPLSLRAHVTALRSALALALSLYDEGVVLAREAVTLFGALGDKEEETRAMVQLGSALGLAGEFEEAQEVLNEATERCMAEPRRHPDLHGAAVINAALVWVEWIDNAEDAAHRSELVQYALDSLDGMRPFTELFLLSEERIHVDWLRGKVLLADRKLDSAERALRRAVGVFAAQDDPLRAGWAGLDLLTVLAFQQRTEEANELAAELVEQFTKAEMPAHVYAALHRAAEARTPGQVLRAVHKARRGAPPKGAPRGIIV